MQTIENLIVNLDRELRILHQSQELAAKKNYGSTAIDPLLLEYLHLTTNETIVSAIQYLVLDGLAQHFQIYRNDRDQQQIIAAMGEEFSHANDNDILVSIQIIQFTYPSLYRISQTQIDLTQVRAIEHITQLPVVASPAQHTPEIEPKHAIESTYTVEPEIVISPVNRNIILVIKEAVLETNQYNKYTQVKQTAKTIAFWLGYFCRISIFGFLMICGFMLSLLGAMLKS